jgi:hypothetical protein
LRGERDHLHDLFVCAGVYGFEDILLQEYFILLVELSHWVGHIPMVLLVFLVIGRVYLPGTVDNLFKEESSLMLHTG